MTKWIVVAALAVGCGSSRDDVEQQRAESERKMVEAQKARAEVTRQQQDAMNNVRSLVRQADDLSKKLDAATLALENAQNDAERTKARLALDELRKERAALERRIECARNGSAC